MLYFCTNVLSTLFQNIALDLSWNMAYSIFMLLFLTSVQVLYLVALGGFSQLQDAEETVII